MPPRRRFRDPDPQVRGRNQLEVLGQPGITGLTRIGGAPGSGQSTVATRGGDVATQGGVEHVTLFVDQTVTAAGAEIEVARTGLAPVDTRGFGRLLGSLADGVTTSFTVDVTGLLVLVAELEFTHPTTGEALAVDVDVAVTRDRTGVLATWPPPVGLTNVVGLSGPLHGWVRAGDTVSLTVTPTTDMVVTGTLQLSVFATDPPTSPRIPYAPVVDADGPILYLRLDESSGTTAADRTGNGHSGTYVGGPSLAVDGLIDDGTDNPAVLLNGSTQYVLLGDVDAAEFAGTAPFSAECWFKLDALPAAGTFDMLIAKSRDNPPPTTEGWDLGVIGTSGQVGFGREGDAAAISADVTAGVRHHVVATYDGTTERLYLDGALVASQSSASAITANAHDLVIGAKRREVGVSGYGAFLDGTVDEVAIYDRALTAAEVLDHWRYGTQTGV